jgi:hypothetical protein
MKRPRADLEPSAYANFDLRAEAETARKPSVRFAFEFPELLQQFESADNAADRARDSTRTQGKLGIALVLLALLYASASPLLHEVDHQILVVAGVAAAVLGIVGTALGLSGLRHSAQRALWLRARLKTETLRLFHFHYIAARLPEIEAASASEAGKQAYIGARRRALEVVLATDLQDLEQPLAAIVANEPSVPFRNVPPLPASGAVSAIAADIFAAWGELRLDWQANYCKAKLAWSSTGSQLSPRHRERAFATLAWACLALIVLFHLLMLGGPLVSEARLHILSPWIETGIIWTALIALAARALEDGLQPQREVERYEQYRAAVTVARSRFDAAADMQTRLEVMRAFERTSLEEMRVFLRTHAGARYVL